MSSYRQGKEPAVESKSNTYKGGTFKGGAFNKLLSIIEKSFSNITQVNQDKLKNAMKQVLKWPELTEIERGTATSFMERWVYSEQKAKDEPAKVTHKVLNEV